MAKTIRLAAGGNVTRAWSRDRFTFQVNGAHSCTLRDEVDEAGGTVFLNPTPQEMLDIAALFRRAGLKLRTREAKKAAYEPPVATIVGNMNDRLAEVCAPHDEEAIHTDDCASRFGDGCDCGA